MANELVTKFVFLSDEGDHRINLTEKRLTELDKRLNTLGSNQTFGKNLNSQFDLLNKSVNQFESNLKNVKTPNLKTLGNDPFKNALADIKRMQAETVKGEQLVTKSVEREAKLQADIKIREQRRAANSFIGSVKQPSQSAPSSGSDLFSSIVGGNLAARAITEVSSAALSGGRAILDYSSKLEQAKIGFTTMTGSADIAQKHLKDLQTFAAKTPFEFSELVTASQKLQGVGVDAQKVIPLLNDVGNALAAAGRIEDLPFATKALGDIQAKGKLAGQEIIQLANAGIPALQILSKELQIPTAEVIKLGEQGKISSDVFFKALHKFSEAKFGDAMVQQSRTFSGAISNIKDSLYITSSSAFEPLYKEISGLSVRFASDIQKQGNNFRGVGNTVAQYIGEGVGLGLNTVVGSLGSYLGTRLSEIGKGKVVDPITKNLVGGFLTSLGEGIGLIDASKKKLAAALESGIEFNGLKYTFDPLTNTMQVLSRTIDNTPSLAVKLDSKKAVKEAEQLLELTNKIAVSGVEQNLELNKAIAVRDAKGDTLKIARDTAALEVRAIREQIALSNNLAAAKIRNISSEDFDSGKGLTITRENDANVSKLQNQLLVTQINLQKQVNDEIEKGKEKTKELGRLYNSTFDNLFERAGANNPFVSVFSEGDKAIKDLRENLKGLSPELTAIAVQMQQKLNADSLFNARIENDFAQFDLKERAGELRSFKQPKIEDIGKFFNDFVEAGLKQLSAANGGSFTRFNRVKSGGFSQSDARNDLLNVYERENTFGGFVSRKRTFADLTNREKDEFINKDNLPLQEKLSRQFALAGNRTALSEEQQAIVDRKIISLSSGLRPEQLTGQQRDLVATANEKEAERKASLEKDAEKDRKQLLIYQKSISENLEALKKIAEKEGFKGIENTLRVVTGDDIEAELKPAATAKDTREAYDDAYKGGTFYEEYKK